MQIRPNYMSTSNKNMVELKIITNPKQPKACTPKMSNRKTLLMNKRRIMSGTLKKRDIEVTVEKPQEEVLTNFKTLLGSPVRKPSDVRIGKLEKARHGIRDIKAADATQQLASYLVYAKPEKIEFSNEKPLK